MATLTTTSGKSLTLKVDSTSTVKVIKNIRSTSRSISQDFEESTTKDSDNFKEYEPTFQDGTMECAGLVSTATDAGLTTDELEDLMLDKTKLYYEWGTGVSGSRKVSGRCYISNFEVTAEYDGLAEFSMSLQFTGDPTVDTYA